MKRTTLLATLSLLALLCLASSRATAQSGGAGGGVSTMTTAHGCWICVQQDVISYCAGGRGGSWNCTTTWAGLCNLSSPGCGVQGMLPLDPDGAAQYVSQELPATSGLAFTDGGPPVRRNCEGIIVARIQAPDNIDEVRARTGSLSL